MGPPATQQTEKSVSFCPHSCLQVFCSARFLQAQVVVPGPSQSPQWVLHGLLASLLPQRNPVCVATAGNDDRHGPSHRKRLAVFWEMDLLVPVCKEAKSPHRTYLNDVLVWAYRKLLRIPDGDCLLNPQIALLDEYVHIFQDVQDINMLSSQHWLSLAPLTFDAEHVASWTIKNTFLTLRQVSRNFCDCKEKLTTWYPLH